MSRPRTVLITGAGGAAVPMLIERLTGEGYRVLAADMDPQAPGLYFAAAGYVIPGGTSADFLPAMRAICAREAVDILVPLVDEELAACLELEQDGVKVLLPRKRFVQTCLDKYELMDTLTKAEIQVPATRRLADGCGDLAFPLVIKPRTGRGSRGVCVVNSAAEVAAYLADSAYAEDELIIQEYVDGPEYTVSVVVWRDGEVQAVVPKEIISKKGITRLAVTRSNALIDEMCRQIQRTLKADGPFNVQLRLDAPTGIPLPFEINPRFSTSISLTIAAGVDELGGLIRQAMDGRDAYRFDAWQDGIVLIRRTADHFVRETDYRGHTIKKWEDEA